MPGQHINSWVLLKIELQLLLLYGCGRAKARSIIDQHTLYAIDVDEHIRLVGVIHIDSLPEAMHRQRPLLAAPTLQRVVKRTSLYFTVVLFKQEKSRKQER